MASALIGHTGFVGGTLLSQIHFDDLYRSNTIEEIEDKTYDLLVCAGAPAAKWQANQQPDRDWENLQRLMHCLDRCGARQFVLISTFDVYPTPVGVDEESEIDLGHNHSYGQHRYLLEKFVQNRFKKHHVVRLPALFGKGLKKNFLFDLLHDNCLDWTHRQSRFQFYNMRNLWRDFKRVLELDLPLVNLTAEPVQAGELARRCFGMNFENETEKPAVAYDVRSRYAHLFGRREHYMYSAADTFNDINAFVASERGAAA